MTTAQDDREARQVIARFAGRADYRTVAHRGKKIVWRRFGEGSPLILLHGGHGSWLHWIRNIDALSAEHALWLPDIPGFGDSDSLEGSPHAPDRMERLVDALTEAMNTLVGSSTAVDLCGFSFGGLTAGFLAAKRGHVRRLALVGPGGHGGARRQAIDLVDWRVGDRDDRLAALTHNLAAFMLHDQRRVDALALAIHEVSCVKTRFRSKTIALAGGLPEALESVSAPMLLLWGEHDVTAVPTELGPRLTHGYRGREFRIVRDTGHWAQYESAGDVNALLREWYSP